MLVFCNGMPRSASTWSYNVTMAILRHTAQGVYGGYDEDLYRFLCGVPASCEHAVLKCHSLDGAGLALAQLHAAKVIYTWRDLADATASYMIMYEAGFEQTVALMSSSLDLLVHHRRNGALVLSYEAVMQQPMESVGAIASYLNVAAPQERIAEIAEANEFGNMRDKLKAAAEGDALASIASNSELVLDRPHIRDGSTGYGARKLNESQLRRLEQLVREKGDLGVAALSIMRDA
jgi:Sulfotransferase domain